MSLTKIQERSPAAECQDIFEQAGEEDYCKTVTEVHCLPAAEVLQYLSETFHLNVSMKLSVHVSTESYARWTRQSG